MNRRTLLRGVAAGSIVPATYVGTAAVASESNETPVSVRIVEASETVAGGDLLEWTVEVENQTDRSARPTLEYFVDGDPAGSVTLTVDPGETERPFSSSYRTEPVARDEDVTLRVEANGDADERTVRLLGVEELDGERRFPDRELAVQPETTVHFEVGGTDPDASQTTVWWVNGERVGDTLASPWQAVYYVEQAAHYWQETFDTAGTHDVVAGVEIDGEQYRASWTVTVTPDGLAEPTIEGARPEPGTLEADRDETTTLEVDVADPDENLERVVWWLSQADVILGESEVSGATDTATLTVDGGFCHTCHIIPWVITSDGTFAGDSVWQAVDPTIGTGDAELDLTITATNDPVDAGEILEVTADCENTGTEPVEQSVDLIVGHDPQRVDTRTVAVDGGATETVVLEFETAVVSRTQTFPVRVEGPDDSDERTVEVIGTEAAAPELDVTITGVNDPVDAGELLEVTVDCENAGDQELTRSVDLIVGHDPTLVDSRSVTVAAERSETVVLEFETAPVPNDQSFPVRVETDGSTDERTVQVWGTGG
ncbi:hypothetical protein [Natronorubrum halalkaliphilum]|uniref:hypothetical protein n=1 Tax=Natronorubrum halalkaliphilum TaxID=2691917 RepID=UPI001915A507|nr:hypothetical protein [Natronorubrum halalkaliphilum]